MESFHLGVLFLAGVLGMGLLISGLLRLGVFLAGREEILTPGGVRREREAPQGDAPTPREPASPPPSTAPGPVAQGLTALLLLEGGAYILKACLPFGQSNRGTSGEVVLGRVEEVSLPHAVGLAAQYLPPGATLRVVGAPPEELREVGEAMRALGIGVEPA
ncbi:MAG: hypothetical protein ACK4G4_12290 [Thermus sp.]|uniref:hypothetical protein n=1 Tax=Thermus sp. TaxID=275 RepID=UPI00391DAB46